MPHRVKTLFFSRESDPGGSGVGSSGAKRMDGDAGRFATRQTDEKRMLEWSGKPEVLGVISAPGVEVGL